LNADVAAVVWLQDWEAEQKRRQEALTKGWNPDGDSEPEEEGGPDDDLPFACYICR
jgi:RING finger protein 113A